MGITEAFLTMVVGGTGLAAIVLCFPALKPWLRSVIGPSESGLGKEDAKLIGIVLLFGILIEGVSDWVYEKAVQGWAAKSALVDSLWGPAELTPIGQQLFERREPAKGHFGVGFLDKLGSPSSWTRDQSQQVYYASKNWFTVNANQLTEVYWLRRRVILERSLVFFLILLAIARKLLPAHVGQMSALYGVAPPHSQEAHRSVPPRTVLWMTALGAGILLFVWYHEEIDYNETVIGTFASEVGQENS